MVSEPPPPSPWLPKHGNRGVFSLDSSKSRPLPSRACFSRVFFAPPRSGLVLRFGYASLVPSTRPASPEVRFQHTSVVSRSTGRDDASFCAPRSRDSAPAESGYCARTSVGIVESSYGRSPRAVFSSEYPRERRAPRVRGTFGSPELPSRHHGGAFGIAELPSHHHGGTPTRSTLHSPEPSRRHRGGRRFREWPGSSLHRRVYIAASFLKKVPSCPVSQREVGLLAPLASFIPSEVNAVSAERSVEIDRQAIVRRVCRSARSSPELRKSAPRRFSSNSTVYQWRHWYAARVIVIVMMQMHNMVSSDSDSVSVKWTKEYEDTYCSRLGERLILLYVARVARLRSRVLGRISEILRDRAVVS